MKWSTVFSAIGTLLIGLAVSVAPAAPIYVDFSDLRGSASGLDGGGSATWNVLTDRSVHTHGLLQTANNLPSGITLAITNDFSADSGGNAGGSWNGAVEPWAINAATEDYFAASAAAGNVAAEILFSDLNPSLTYRVALIASRTAASHERDGIYRVNGLDPDSGATQIVTNNAISTYGELFFNTVDDGWLGKNILVWNAVAPDANNQIRLTAYGAGNVDGSQAGNADWTYFNALQLEAVPEPGTIVLLLTGAVATLMFWRRRR